MHCLCILLHTSTYLINILWGDWNPISYGKDSKYKNYMMCQMLENWKHQWIKYKNETKNGFK